MTRRFPKRFARCELVCPSCLHRHLVAIDFWSAAPHNPLRTDALPAPIVICGTEMLGQTEAAVQMPVSTSDTMLILLTSENNASTQITCKRRFREQLALQARLRE